MENKNKKSTSVLLFAGALMLTGLSGCSFFGMSNSSSSRAQIQEIVANRESGKQAPGAVQYVWEEPMVDVIDVPPGLDPEGNYYRPAHQEVVEIRQGRYKYYKDK